MVALFLLRHNWALRALGDVRSRTDNAALLLLLDCVLFLDDVSPQIRYQCSRASGTFVVTYTRGTVTAVFSMSSPRAASIGGPLRLVVFSTSQGAKYSFFSVYGTVTVANCKPLYQY